MLISWGPGKFWCLWQCQGNGILPMAWTAHSQVPCISLRGGAFIWSSCLPRVGSSLLLAGLLCWQPRALLGDLMLIAHPWDIETRAAKASSLNKPPRYHSDWKTTLSAFQSCQSTQQLWMNLSLTQLGFLKPSLCKWPTKGLQTWLNTHGEIGLGEPLSFIRTQSHKNALNFVVFFF